MNHFQSGMCPVCQSKLQIQRFSCPECKSEYPINKSLSPYDCLSDSQQTLLTTFLICRGNLKAVGAQLHASYPTIKKRFDELLVSLDLEEEAEPVMEEIDMCNFGTVDFESTSAAEIVKRKLYENGGSATIALLDGKPCRIVATADGTAFTSDKLNSFNLILNYSVFDTIASLLLNANNYKAPKGNAHGREDKVGSGKCTEDTVVGYVARHYFKKQEGESVYDPTFVLAAVLDWAGVSRNCRGYLELTPEYLNLTKK